ncbi:MAG: hypothetical protein ACUVRO_07180 [Armatimonadota bacterium]
MDRRRLRAVHILLLALCAWRSAPAGAQAAVLLGDLTGDRRITIHDAVVALRIAVNALRASSSQLAAGDIAPSPGTQGREFGDGRVTSADAAEILRRAVGLAPDPWPSTASAKLLPHASLSFLTSASRLDVVLPSGWTVSGRVVDERGRPFTGSIRLFSDVPEVAGECRLASDGSYRLTAPSGAYSVELVTELAGDGYTLEVVQRQVRHVTVQSDTRLDITRPALPVLPLVTGEITSVDGRFKAQSVTFVDIELPNDTRRRRSNGTAAVIGGKYSIRLPVGQYKIFITGTATAGGITRTITIMHPEIVRVGADRPLPIRVPLIRTLSGTITDAAGKPATAGSVAAVSPFVWGQRARYTSPIGVDGRYSLLLTQDQYTLLVTPQPPPAGASAAPSYVVQGVSVSADRVLNIRIPAQPAIALVTGSVADERGRPLWGAEVSLESVDLSQVSRTFRVSIYTKTELDGYFEVRIPEGRYILRVFPPWDTYPPGLINEQLP